MKKLLVVLLVLAVLLTAAWWLRARFTADEPAEPLPEPPTPALRLGMPQGQPLAPDAPIALSLALEPQPSWAADPDRRWPRRVRRQLTFGSPEEPWWSPVELTLSGPGGKRALAFEPTAGSSPPAADLAPGEAGYVTLWLPPDHGLGPGRHELVATGRWGARELRSAALALEITQAASGAARAAMTARCHLALGRPEAALALLETAVSATPAIAPLHGLRGEALEARGDLRGALAAYRTAAKLADQQAPAVDEPPFYWGRVNDLMRKIREGNGGA